MPDIAEGPSLRTALLELLTEPRTPTAAQVWKALSKPERTRALWHLLAAPDLRKTFRQLILRALQSSGGFRAQTLEKLDAAALAERAASRCPASELPVEAALRELHLRDRRQLLTAFLDAAAIAHDCGIIDQDTLPNPELTPAVVSSAVAALAGRFSPEDVAIYLLTLVAIEPESWPGVNAWRRFGAEELATAPARPHFDLEGPPLSVHESPAETDEITGTTQLASDHPDDPSRQRVKEMHPEATPRIEEHEPASTATALATARVDLDALGEELHSLADELSSTAVSVGRGEPPPAHLSGRIDTARDMYLKIAGEVAAIAGGADDRGATSNVASLREMLQKEEERREAAAVHEMLSPAAHLLREARCLEGPETVHDSIMRVRHEAGRLLDALDFGGIDEETRETITAIVHGAHALTALVVIAKDEDQLELARVSSLAAAITAAYGEPLARAAVRGRLSIGANATSAEAASEPAPDSRENKAPPVPRPPSATPVTEGEPSQRSSYDAGASNADLGGPAETTVARDAGLALAESTTASPVSEAAASAASREPQPSAEAQRIPREDLVRSVEAVSDVAQERPVPTGDRNTVGGLQHEQAAWRRLAEDEPIIAYYHCVLAEQQGAAVHLSPRLVRAICLAPHLTEAVSPIGELLAEDLTSLALETLLQVESEEEQQALRLLIVAASLRAALLAPASEAAALLESLRYGAGFTKLWELCGEIVAFSRGGLVLAPDILATVSSKAAWAGRLAALQDEAQKWFAETAPAYRFQFAGATNVWRKMLEKGNLVYEIVQPVVENAGPELAAVQSRIEALSSMDEIHRRIQRIDREQVRRPRGADIQARALRQLESAVLEALDLGRKWVQLQRVNPAGGEGWRLEQAGNLRDSLVRLRPGVDAEFRAARERTPCIQLEAAVVRCSEAIMDTCRLFEGVDPRPSAEEGPGEILATPLLLRPLAPIKTDGTVDVSRQDALAAALAQAVSHDRREQWYTAYDERLAKDDFVGTQLLLDKADKLGVRLDESERQRRNETRTSAIEARKHSLLYDIKQTRRSVAQGAALGFLRESDHNELLASVDRAEIAATASVDFATIDQDLRTVKAKLSSLRHSAVAEVRDRLRDTEEVSEEMSLKVRALLEKGDVLTATEVLQNRAQWAIAAGHDSIEDRHFGPFLAFLRDVPAETPSGASGLTLLPAGEGRPDRPDYVSQEAAGVASAWTDRRPNQIDTGLTKRVFSLLGFTGVHAEPARENTRWQEVRTVPVRDRTRCPVPLFGSRADGNYRVVWLWEPTSPEDIASAVAERASSRDEAVIVFYFGRLDEAQRRTLRLENIRHRMRFIVLDDALLAYLARLKGTRMAAFFACALPFASIVPYHTLAGAVPPEMFYGRYQQRSAIEDRDGTGTCLVFGGRQLGKTALLKDVQRTFGSRADGRIAIYADLKAAGVGVHRDADAVWEVIAEELKRAQIMVVDRGRRKPEPTRESVEQAVQAWLARAPNSNRILLLLDEADLFFKADGETRDFANAHHFKVLMDRTQRAFKVVFAGLHNVQRSTRIANHPLAHFGVPACVGPMVEGAEWKAAVDLVERPLAALGYEIDRDLTIRILSHTNYYPSLIQIYCSELLKHVSEGVNRYAAERGPLPANITPAQVEEAYRSVELRQRIKQSFDLTLNLDPRYKVIALCVADATTAREPWVHTPKDISVGELRSQVMSIWGDGFKADRSEDGFRALLDEMVGLGVLRRSAENRYALRGANVPLLLGSEEEVVEKLLSLDPPESFEFAPDTYRRPLADVSGAPSRAPLTTRQEFELSSARNGVAIVLGVPAAGLEEVRQCFASASRVSSQVVSPKATLEQYAEQLRTILTKGGPGTTLLVAHPEVEWSERWVHCANELLRVRRSQERFVRTVFVGGPLHAWELVRDHGGAEKALGALRELGVVIHSLQPWRPVVVRHWLEDQQLSTANDALKLEVVAARTGNWPKVLLEYVRLARGRSKGTVSSAAAASFDGVLVGTARSDWAVSFGLGIEETRRVLASLAELARELQGPVSLDGLVVLAEVDPDLAQRALEWADILGLASPAAQGDGAPAWALDPIVARLLGESAPVPAGV